MKQKTDTALFTFKLPRVLRELSEAIARKKGISLSEYYRIAIAKQVKEDE